MIRRVLTAVLIAIALVSASAIVPELLENVAQAPVPLSRYQDPVWPNGKVPAC